LISQTSLDSWCKLQEENRINANQTIIVDVFKSVSPKPLSNFDIGLLLNWPINRITPRVNELRKKGRIIMVSKKFQLETNRLVQVYALSEDYYNYKEAFQYFQ